jgi:hypothetical protein
MEAEKGQPGASISVYLALLWAKEETFTTARLKGVFGALRDAGPDYCN